MLNAKVKKVYNILDKPKDSEYLYIIVIIAIYIDFVL